VDPILYSFKSTDQLADSLADFVLDAQNEALAKRETFKLAISGGSLAKQLNGLLKKSGVQWDKWCVGVSARTL
jgi:6-phosphogluconolactonase